MRKISILIVAALLAASLCAGPVLAEEYYPKYSNVEDMKNRAKNSYNVRVSGYVMGFTPFNLSPVDSNIAFVLADDPNNTNPDNPSVILCEFYGSNANRVAALVGAVQRNGGKITVSGIYRIDNKGNNIIKLKIIKALGYTLTL